MVCKDTNCVLSAARQWPVWEPGPSGAETGLGKGGVGGWGQIGKTENKFSFSPWLTAVSSLPCHDDNG